MQHFLANTDNGKSARNIKHKRLPLEFYFHRPIHRCGVMIGSHKDIDFGKQSSQQTWGHISVRTEQKKRLTVKKLQSMNTLKMIKPDNLWALMPKSKIKLKDSWVKIIINDNDSQQCPRTQRKAAPRYAPDAMHPAFGIANTSMSLIKALSQNPKISTAKE